jgi:hypothetical protein
VVSPAAKEIDARTRHLLVNTLKLLLAVKVPQIVEALPCFFTILWAVFPACASCSPITDIAGHRR